MSQDTSPAERRSADRSADDTDDGAGSRLKHHAKRVHRGMHANPALTLLSKIVVGVVGTAVLVAGIVMIVTPGPAIVLVPLGLAILASEFSWARHALETARRQAVKARKKAEAQDPAVRRRNRLVVLGVVVVVVGAAVAYVAVFDWPGYAVSGWDWLQQRFGLLPELPGM